MYLGCLLFSQTNAYIVEPSIPNSQTKILRKDVDTKISLATQITTNKCQPKSFGGGNHSYNFEFELENLKFVLKLVHDI